MSDREIVVFVKNETVGESVYKDFVSLIMLSFCVYISQDSTWWTFVTGLMFISFIAARVYRIVDKNSTTFKTKAALLAWVNKLEDEA